VWEGDLLRDEEGNVLEILWDDSRARFVTIDRTGGGYMKWVEPHIARVIGNIYEGVRDDV
jgi:hypothetical protein